MTHPLNAHKLGQERINPAINMGSGPADMGSGLAGTDLPGAGLGKESNASSPTSPLLETVWEVSVYPSDPQDAAWRERLLAQIRIALEKKLEEAPESRELTLRSPLGTVEVRPRDGQASPSGHTEKQGSFRLAFASATQALAVPKVSSSNKASASTGGSQDSGSVAALPWISLPDAPTQQLGQRLVGLEDMKRDVLLRWQCQWDGALDAWAARTDGPLPPALRELLRTGHALEVFHGDSGVGKSALARVLADTYCRHHGTHGAVLWLTTQARGDGLVGAFSQRLRSAFAQLAGLPADVLKVLIIDEADSLAMRRSEAQSHQEDKAATSTLIQCLDSAAGTRRLAVIMTTNTLENMDAAILRRGRLIPFSRPDAEARQALLVRWLPRLNAGELASAVAAAAGMTPADIDRALEKSWLGAVAAETYLTPAEAISALHRAARTGCV